jgi:hypothetical protein
MFQTGRDLGSFQHDIHLVAWKVPTGEVRSVYTSSSSLGPYLSRSYLLSDGTVVFSGGTAGGPGPGNTVSELVAYDRPFKGRTVLDRSDHSNIDPQPVDPGSLAVAGRTAYWRHSGAVRTAKIPH